MNKRDYLVKTFSRTKRKDYENYILTAIWHNLNNMDLKPVSQQYVKRKNGTHALMDLYFPQLHIEVEVDEAYHQNNQEADKLRMDDIISAVNEESEDFLCLRIDASKSIEEINDRINGVVSIIKDRASSTSLKWLTYEEELDQVRQQEYLSIYDDISFNYIKDIANTVFDRNVKGLQHAYFKAKDKMRAWCPKLSIIVDGNLKSIAGGWLNLLAEDWTYIDESHQDGIDAEKRSGYMDEMNSDRERAVFAKYKDNLGFNRYRFVGVYKCSGLSPEDESYIRYVRIDDKVKIVK